MRRALCLLFLLLPSCSLQLVRDQAPASIEMGWKRLETVVCDRWEVGDNGCVLPEGKLGDARLRIYRVLRGEISVIGQGCKVDYNTQYEYDKKNPWVDIKLTDLVKKDSITSDCVLTVYQRVTFPHQNSSPIPVQGIYGTVTLGICPAGNTCSFDSEQVRAGWNPSHLVLNTVPSGQYLLRGCGQEMVPITPFNGPIDIDVEQVWPKPGFPQAGKSACTLIFAIRGSAGERVKMYRKVSVFDERTVRLEEPSITIDSFRSDPSISLTIAGSKIINDSEGKWHPNPDGDYLRFYTVQGRTLVAFVRKGVVEWTK